MTSSTQRGIAVRQKTPCGGNGAGQNPKRPPF